MRCSPRNVEIAFSHGSLTHYGGVLYFNEFTRVLQLRPFLTRHLPYHRRNQHCQFAHHAERRRRKYYIEFIGYDLRPFSRNFMEFTQDPGMSPTLVIGRKRLVQGFELLTALPILC
jgi:hypothetical protein